MRLDFEDIQFCSSVYLSWSCTPFLLQTERFEVSTPRPIPVEGNPFQRFLEQSGLSVSDSRQESCGTFEGTNVTCLRPRLVDETDANVWKYSMPWVATPPFAAPLPVVDEKLDVVTEAYVSSALSHYGRSGHNSRSDAEYLGSSRLRNPRHSGPKALEAARSPRKRLWLRSQWSLFASSTGMERTRR